MLSPEMYFKCLSDETRLRCMMLLYQEGELCVCELTAALALSQPKISRHLAQLRQMGLLIDNRIGQWVFYKMDPQLPPWSLSVLAAIEQAMMNDNQYQQDKQRLHRLGQRLRTACK